MDECPRYNSQDLYTIQSNVKLMNYPTCITDRHALVHRDTFESCFALIVAIQSFPNHSDMLQSCAMSEK